MTNLQIKMEISKAALESENNQDMIGKSKSAIWIADGTTEVTPLKLKNNQDGVVWFVRNLNDYLYANIDQIDLSIEEILRQSIIKIKTDFTKMVLEKIDINSLSMEKQPSAAIASARILKNNELELFLLGDCTIYIQNTPHELLIQDFEIKKIEMNFTKDLLKNKKNYPNISHNEFLHKIKKKDLIKGLRLELWEQNKFDVLNFNTKMILEGFKCKIPIKKTMKVLLVTDGFTRLIDYYNIFSNYSEFLFFLEKKGIEKLYKLLREIEKSDSNAEKFPRMKLSDDASLIYAEINQFF